MPIALVIQHEDYEALAGFQKPLKIADMKSRGSMSATQPTQP